MAFGGDASFLAFDEDELAFLAFDEDELAFLAFDEDELAFGGDFFFGVTIELHKFEGISLFEYNWESISSASFISTNRSLHCFFVSGGTFIRMIF